MTDALTPQPQIGILSGAPPPVRAGKIDLSALGL
jgi:hypothetical protein